MVCSMGVNVQHSWGMTELSPVGVYSTLKVSCQELRDCAVDCVVHLKHLHNVEMRLNVSRRFWFQISRV